MQQPPDSGVALIKQFEGCHTDIGNSIYESYLCPAGVWTIGWGTTSDEYNNPIHTGGTDCNSRMQVDRYLLSECDAGMFILADTIPYWGEMSDDQHGALFSPSATTLAGIFYSSSGFDTITRELQNRNWNPGVPDALMLYVKGNGQTMPGLVRRRQAEADHLASRPQRSTPITSCTSHGYLHP